MSAKAEELLFVITSIAVAALGIFIVVLSFIDGW